MKETKQAPATPEARAAMHEMMAAFEAFKGANDARLDEIERKASADSLIDLVYAPKAQYRPNARFVMNRRTVSAVRKFKDADGNYIWQPAQRAGETASLLGYPVSEIETMPDIAANAPAIAFGDFRRGYLIVDRAGVRVLRDPYSAKPYVLFYTTRRVGGGVQDFDAIKVMKFSAT